MSAAGTTIHLCTAADGNYLAPSAAMVRSAMEHVSDRRVELYVLTKDVTGEERRRLLASWPFENLQVHWLEADDTRLAGLPRTGWRDAGPYRKLLIDTALPRSVSRVLWLDSDVIVLRDPYRLWATPLDGKPVGAVADLTVPRVGSARGLRSYRELGLDGSESYFNSGVLLIDLDRWRTQCFSPRAVEYLRSHSRELVYYEQDGLNAVLAKEWKPLDPRWNVIECVAGRPFFRPRHLTGEEYRRLLAEPWIVHYAGRWKPWTQPNGGPWRRLFFDYLDRTEWAGWGRSRTLAGILLSCYETQLRRYAYRFEDPVWSAAAALRRLAARTRR